MKKALVAIGLGLSLLMGCMHTICTVPKSQVPEIGMTKSQVEETIGINTFHVRKYKVDEWKHFIERWTIYRECNPTECTYFIYKASDGSDVFYIYFDRNGIVKDIVKQ